MPRSMGRLAAALLLRLGSFSVNQEGRALKISGIRKEELAGAGAGAGAQKVNAHEHGRDQKREPEQEHFWPTSILEMGI